MKTVNSENPNTNIVAKDDFGPGGASHEYVVLSSTRKEEDDTYVETYATINFQKGPVRENGGNGCSQEDLLAIVIDRLQSFQNGPFPCRENAIALTKCQEALHWLNHRTAERTRRGVEGKNQI